MRVVTRRIGGTPYYYLQHSFRKDGKVLTREKYLGTALPAGLERMKRALLREQRAAVAERLERIRAHFQREWRAIPASARARELEELAIAFTYNTNAIEGSTITLAETRALLADATAPAKPLRDVKETEAHARVFRALAEQRPAITQQLLLEWHRALFNETKPDIAGAYRTYHVRVGPYRAPDWQDVRQLMGELFSFLRIAASALGGARAGARISPVELAARAHYRFEKVHPFGDGNGRVGRLLLNAILWRAGYPMLIIEKRGRASYYRALQGTEDRFVAYFLRRYFAVHRSRLR